jgi:imidazoleglycerol-phosphate dehydratase / histidinol-phosphatase
MNVLFLDRDGTLICEPTDFRVDSLAKLSFLPGVIRTLRLLQELDFHLVIVSNQDGLGTADYAWSDFQPAHDKMLEIFAGEGVTFDFVAIDTHFEADQHPNRKPNTGMVAEWLANHPVDLSASYMIGDRKTDALFAHNLGVQSLTIKAPQSNDGDVKCTHIEQPPTIVFHHWDDILAYITEQVILPDLD